MMLWSKNNAKYFEDDDDNKSTRMTMRGKNAPAPANDAPNT